MTAGVGVLGGAIEDEPLDAVVSQSQSQSQQQQEGEESEAKAATTTAAARTVHVPTATTTTTKRQQNPQQHRFRMVALDLDGTLLSSSRNRVSKETVQYLQHLYSDRGIQIVIATGRAQGKASVYDVVRRLNLPCLHDGRGMPVVCSNGAKGLLIKLVNDEGAAAAAAAAEGSESSQQHQPKKKLRDTIVIQELFSYTVPISIVRHVLFLCSKPQRGLVVQYYVHDRIYANPSNDQHYELTNRYMIAIGVPKSDSTNSTIYVNDNFESLIKKGAMPSKLLIMCPECDVNNVYYKLGVELGGDNASATLIKGPWFVEVLNKQVNKGEGFKRMCESHFKIPMQHVIAFGDSYNDTEFLQVAGKGVAMKNGIPAIKSMADDITQYTNDQDGVRKYLEQKVFF